MENGIQSLMKRIMCSLTGNGCGERIPANGPRSKLLNRHVHVMILLLFVIPLGAAYGHGVGSETFPPVDLDGKQVALELSSSRDDSDPNSQQITIALVDFDSKITLRDVTFHIRAERGEQFLFEREFKAGNGSLVFNFVSENADLTVEEQAGSSLFDSLLGLEGTTIHVKGPKLSEGGLYKFGISILTAGSYSNLLDEPLSYNAGISLPQTVTHPVYHHDYGHQAISTITYYDELYDFDYDVQSKTISFSMQFEWTEENIEQTSVVHQELVIPKEFGDLLVSGFTIHINDIKLSDDIVTIDDFLDDERTVHFIVNQQEIWNVFEENTDSVMNFVITPKSKTQLSSVTDNGQFGVLVSWEPERLESNSEAVLSFAITDLFFKDKAVAVDYDLSVVYNDVTLFGQSGTSADASDGHSTARFRIPDGTSGIIHVNFENIDGNPHAMASLPVVVDSLVPDTRQSPIPSWIKNNAAWWADGHIDDHAFLGGIEFLIQNNILILTSEPVSIHGGSQDIPSWIKNNAAWWADGHIDDHAFLGGIEFLIENGILQIQ